MTNTIKWTEPELLHFLDEKEKESIYLDYKGSDALGKTDRKKRELSKDVSAFANSAGGRLIYGVAEDGHFPTGLDSGIDPDEITKEWLEQVIGSLIHRRISGIRIYQVNLTSSAPGRVAYVLEIPQSNLAPHQAADKCFYKRYNFESRPMEEYEIRDVFLRGDGPDLKLSVSMELKDIPDSDIPIIRLSSFMENLSSVPSEYSSVSLFIDEKLEVQRIGSPFKHHGTNLYHVGEESVPCNH
ncbi:MAG: AlbA family DNA-binding domain-containing protein [Thermoleophilia bacterium]